MVVLASCVPEPPDTEVLNWDPKATDVNNHQALPGRQLLGTDNHLALLGQQLPGRSDTSSLSRWSQTAAPEVGSQALAEPTSLVRDSKSRKYSGTSRLRQQGHNRQSIAPDQLGLSVLEPDTGSCGPGEEQWCDAVGEP